MDIEFQNRTRIRNAIEEHFDVWEEVSVTTAWGKLRMDIVAIPKSSSDVNCPIGFEVKAPTSALNFNKWAQKFKQAADYVGATVSDARLPQGEVRAVFVFPSPPYIPYSEAADAHHGSEGEEIWFRSDQLLQYAGVLSLAEQFRVGYGRFETQPSGSGLCLSMGANPIWFQKLGWTKSGRDLINSKRVGSQVRKA